MIASRPAPSRARTVPAARSQTTRGRSCGECVGRVAAGEQVEDRGEHAVGELGEVRGAPDRAPTRSSTAHSSTAVIATICCASTSSGLRGYRVASISGVEHPLGDHGGLEQVAAVLREELAHARRADLVAGAADPLHARSPPSPARPPGRRGRPPPCRCRARARRWRRSRGGGPPSGRPRPRPAARARSTRGAPGPAPPRRGRSAATASRSAPRRSFTNTIVERCARISSRSTGWIDGQIERRSTPGGAASGASTASPIAPMSSTGTITSRSSVLRTPASTTVDVARPPRCRRSRRGTARSPRAAAGWPRARSVAAAASPSASSRSSDSIRCAPRFVAASAWISSTITVSTCAERLARRRGEHQVERLGCRDQDVGRMRQQASPLRGASVSPVRTPTVGTWGSVRPDALGRVRDPRERRAEVLLDVDGERAERRDVEDPRALPRRGRGAVVASRSIAHRNAARVLPDPVGASRSVCAPARDRRPAGRSGRRWAPSNEASNQARVSGENASSVTAAPRYRLPPTRGAAPVRCGDAPRRPHRRSVSTALDWLVAPTAASGAGRRAAARPTRRWCSWATSRCRPGSVVGEVVVVRGRRDRRRRRRRRRHRAPRLDHRGRPGARGRRVGVGPGPAAADRAGGRQRPGRRDGRGRGRRAGRPAA